MEVIAPEPLRAFLLRHLELQRYRDIQDLDAAELARLRAQATANARELLATQGHFSPRISVEQLDALQGEPLGRVRLDIDPGPPTQISAVEIAVDAQPSDPSAAQATALRDRVLSQWALKVGDGFSQSAWDGAKAQGLRLLSARRYPNAQLADSLADVDPATQSARLSVRYELGAPVTLGEIEVQGAERYDPAIARRLALLAGLTPGSEYDLARLQAAQRRLAESGYYNSAFAYVDTSERSDQAPVRLQLREARLQKLELGVGVSTDSGPRLSLEHTHHRVPGLAWRAVSRLRLERSHPLVETEWSSPVDDQGWRWVASGLAQRQKDQDLRITSQRLRAGQTQDGETLDRSYYLQWDRARTDGGSVETALSLNYAWTRRQFDNPLFPERGYGLGVELGVGTTLASDQRDPYFRTRVRWQGVRPAPGAAPGRLVLRLEGGAVLARDRARVPATQRFLTGGDTTVRGYGLRDIGVETAGGGIAPGRYMGVVSLEWQRPLGWGLPREWEHTVFIDSGGVADRPGDIKPRTGVGTGLRYNSPVGPLQLDLAYGVQARQLRIHLSVGFTF